MKIAILFQGCIEARKGLFNSVINRIKSLKNIHRNQNITIDAFCIVNQPSVFAKLLRNESDNSIGTIEIDGVKIRMIPYRPSIIDVIGARIHLGYAHSEKKKYEYWASILSEYSLISAHSLQAAKIAMFIKRHKKIPVCITWHGSDIHTLPKRSENLRNEIMQLLEGADVNFFVSKSLAIEAHKLTDKAAKSIVSYNGASEEFRPMDKTKCRAAFNLPLDCNIPIVGYAGNFIHLKNAHLLPEIFESCRRHYNGDVFFALAGTGPLKSQIIEKLNKYPDIKWFYVGDVSPDRMPIFYNAIDLLLLPSRNEGLAMVLVEAIQCGINAIGTNTGGVTEVVGKNFVVELEATLSDNLGRLAAKTLEQKPCQCISSEMSWTATAHKEYAIYQSLLKNYITQ